MPPRERTYRTEAIVLRRKDIGEADRILTLLRRGGLMAIDNVFWGGEVAQPEVDNVSVRGIRELNRILASDERVSLSMVPIADGLTLARKR